jgi:predicted nucleotidyltransferase
MDIVKKTADDELLEEIVRRIVSVGDPEQIVLFGSRARLQSTEDSDIDILVIEESDEPRYKRSPRYYSATRGTFLARDIVVWTPTEIREWETVPNHFVTTALREGRLLYERPD